MKPRSLLVRLALRCYPEPWRDHYGADARAVTEDLLASGRGSLAIVFDLLRGAVDAHVHPQHAAPVGRGIVRARSSASMASAWVMLFPVLVVGLAALPADASVRATGMEVTALDHSIRIAAVLAALGLTLALVSLAGMVAAAFRQGDAPVRRSVHRAFVWVLVFLAGAPAASAVVAVLHQARGQLAPGRGILSVGSLLPIPRVLTLTGNTPASTVVVDAVATVLQLVALVIVASSVRQSLGAVDHSGTIFGRFGGLTVVSVGVMSIAWAWLAFWMVELLLRLSTVDLGAATGQVSVPGYLPSAAWGEGVATVLVTLSGMVILRGVAAAARWLRAPAPAPLPDGV